MLPSPSPSSLSLSSNTIQKTIQEHLLPYKLTLANIEDLPRHIHRICRVNLSNGSRLILKLPPPTSTLLLRHERDCLKTEACVLSLLAKTNLPIAKVVKYDKKPPRLNTPFLLTTHLPGISYADALPYLSRSEGRGIESQLRDVSSIISQIASPSFGPAALVAANKGHSSWREAFSSMMESVLMDGEDMMINLPYITIRDYMAAFGKDLDGIKSASQVVPGLAQPKNILIERRTNSITGLLDFSQALWGDPAFASPESGLGSSAGTRGLLYSVYHSVVAIVTNHYRPQRGEGEKELDARKMLTTTLGRLAKEREGA